MSTTKVVLGILGGVAAGALMGVLFAPAEGKKTRKKIIDKGNEFADDMKEKFEDLYENVTDKYDTLLHDAKDLVSNHEKK